MSQSCLNHVSIMSHIHCPSLPFAPSQLQACTDFLWSFSLRVHPFCFLSFFPSRFLSLSASICVRHSLSSVPLPPPQKKDQKQSFLLHSLIYTPILWCMKAKIVVCWERGLQASFWKEGKGFTNISPSPSLKSELMMPCWWCPADDALVCPRFPVIM